MTGAFSAYFQKLLQPSGGDTVDHTASAYVLDRKGTFRAQPSTLTRGRTWRCRRSAGFSRCQVSRTMLVDLPGMLRGDRSPCCRAAATLVTSVVRSTT